MGKCDIIPKSEAKPGDLIFFQKTYNTSGASHVGIYVGNGMMIHCGNPISYASIETSYWRQHYYCMGRIKNRAFIRPERIRYELETGKDCCGARESPQETR